MRSTVKQGAAYLDVKGLSNKKKPEHLTQAARHNLREIQAELGASSHIDATRMHLNIILAGPSKAADVVAAANGMMSDAEVGKLRKDAVMALEALISIPESASIDREKFFSDSLGWLAAFYQVPILSAVIHFDESEPHMHVLLLPLIKGRMQGSDLIGNKTKLRDMQTRFYHEVAIGYGFARPMQAQRRTSAQQRKEAANTVLKHLQQHPERLKQPNMASLLRECIQQSPGRFMDALGLDIPAHKPAKQKTMAQIFTSKAKPEPSFYRNQNL